MNREHFQSQIGRLVNRFPGKTYGEEFITLLWRDVKGMSDHWLTQTVDEFIGSCRQPPLIPEFREQVGIQREKDSSRQNQSSTPIDWNRYIHCDHCKENGTFICVRNDKQGGFYAFRCHCEKGSTDTRRGIPQFKTEHTKEFHYFDIVEHRRRMANA